MCARGRSLRAGSALVRARNAPQLCVDLHDWLRAARAVASLAMPDRYLVELESPESVFDIQSVGARSRAASKEVSRHGMAVRFLRSVFVPEDGSCLLIFEGDSIEAVTEACTRAAIDVGRVSRTLDLTTVSPPERSEALPSCRTALTPVGAATRKRHQSSDVQGE